MSSKLKFTFKEQEIVSVSYFKLQERNMKDFFDWQLLIARITWRKAFSRMRVK